MNKYRFSKTSQDRLNTCESELIHLLSLSLQYSPVDFGIACGHRSTEEQQALYARGRTEPRSIVTNIDGISKLSKHNHKPSKAVDIYAWVNGKVSWDKEHLCLIAGVIYATAQAIGVKIRWGGNWDGDGEIISDQILIDLPHYELY